MNQDTQTNKPEPVPPREYERSGLYPENGKAFRIWALLAWLAATVVVIAGASMLLDHLLRP